MEYWVIITYIVLSVCIFLPGYVILNYWIALYDKYPFNDETGKTPEGRKDNYDSIFLSGLILLFVWYAFILGLWFYNLFLDYKKTNISQYIIHQP